MRKKGNKMKSKNKSWSGKRTWFTRTFMSNDLRLRPFGHDNSHKPLVLSVGIENARAL